jgi:ABC-type phosphate transport system permease subunit
LSSGLTTRWPPFGCATAAILSSAVYLAQACYNDRHTNKERQMRGVIFAVSGILIGAVGLAALFLRQDIVRWAEQRSKQKLDLRQGWERQATRFGVAALVLAGFLLWSALQP